MLPSPPAEMEYRNPHKRKRSLIEDEAQRNKTFTLQELTTSSDTCFEPLSKLLRAHLPLSWLAAVSPSSVITPASILQGEIRFVSAWEYSILVVRHVPNGGLYVLDKFDDDCFVVQPLQPFVTEQWVKDASIGAAPPVSMQMMLHYLQEPDHTRAEHLRQTPSLVPDQPIKMPKNRRGAAARMSILSQTETRPDSPTSPLLPSFADTVEAEFLKSEIPTKEEHASQLVPQLPVEQSGIVDQAPPAEEVRSDLLSPAYLRQRYLEHLYKSKTSLAYYAKGPLSRARARARAQDASMTLSQLASFYRESILPAKKMDLKYKETMKEIIANVAIHEEANQDAIAKKKPTKKTKLGKNGLWPTEPHFISQWWHSRALKTAPAPEQREVEVRDAVAYLRMREAQMQIILILEMLSIEAKENEKGRQPAPESAEVKAESIEQDGKADQPEKRSKQRDLEADLEVLADKLCIWHSVGLENTFVSSDTTKTHASEEEQSESKDRLRNFCTDVIIAFYNARLPLICRSLCKTLAGPEVYEQSQKISHIKQGASQHAPPGSIIRRRVPSASGRMLERILSDNGLRQTSPPTLSRSSTLPPLSQFKREPSELSQRPPSRSSRRTSVNFTNREVDLAADAQATASKRRKLEMVAYAKKETDVAIQALKKPNRAGASKAYMDEIEKRKSTTNKQSIQITATPRASRKKMLPDTQDSIELPTLHPEDTTIPSSTTKPRRLASAMSVPRSSAKKRAVLAAIYDTPSRGSTKKTDPLHLVINHSESATKSSTTTAELVFATPQKPKSINMYSTPQKQLSASPRDIENEFRVTEVAFETMRRAMGDNAVVREEKGSIYDTLGWNDDYDI